MTSDSSPGYVRVRRDDLKRIITLFDKGDTTVTAEDDAALDRLFEALSSDDPEAR